MKLRNPFSSKTREFFRDLQYTCSICGGNGTWNGGTELNHTSGRVSSSPVNGSVLCKECHGKVGHSYEEEKKLFTVTLRYLFKIKYNFTPEDISFIEGNRGARDALMELQNETKSQKSFVNDS